MKTTSLKLIAIFLVTVLFLIPTQKTQVYAVDQTLVTSNYQCLGDALAEYLIALIDAKKAGDLNGMKLLSPAFNLTSGTLPGITKTLKEKLESKGYSLSDLDGIAGNLYNAGGMPMQHFMQTNVIPNLGTQKIYITETGNSSDYISADLADTLKTLFNSNSNVEGALLFNALLTNNDSNFDYHKLTEKQITDLCNQLGNVCSKLGFNLGTAFQDKAKANVPVNNEENAYNIANNLGMGYTLQILENNSNSIESAKTSIANYQKNNPNAKVIIRIGVGSSDGGFGKDPKNYIKALQEIAKANGIDPNRILVIGGPNEPDAESWLAPNCYSACGNDTWAIDSLYCPPDGGVSCLQPFTSADSGTCVSGCSGTGTVIPQSPISWVENAWRMLVGWKYKIDVTLASFVGSGNPTQKSEQQNTKPSSLAIVTGSNTKNLNSKSFSVDWGEKVTKTEDEGKNPPKHINNLVSMVDPESGQGETMRQGFEKLVEIPTKVIWYIENAAKIGGVTEGYIPDNTELAQLGIKIGMPKNNCVEGCYLPTITYCPNTAIGDCGGGDHHIYTNDSKVYMTSLDGSVAPQYGKDHPMGNDRGLVIAGPDNYAPVKDLGMIALNDKGEVQYKQHVAFKIDYNFKTKTQADEYFAKLAYQGPPEEEIVDESGGPIETAQKNIYAEYVANCSVTQSYFGTPETILSTAITKFPGINRQLFSKQVEQTRLAYIENQEKKYLALNLSNNEKYKIQVEKLLNNGYSNYLENKKIKENSNFAENKLANLTSNASSTETKDTLQQIASFGYDSNLECPNAENTSTTKGCSPNSSNKPNTTIYVNPGEAQYVDCKSDKDCEASGVTNDHRIFVSEHFVGTCRDIRSPDGVCTPLNPAQITYLKQDGDLVGTELPLNNCAINNIVSIFSTPAETKEQKLNDSGIIKKVDSKKRYDLIATGGDYVEFNSDGDKEPMKKDNGSTPYKFGNLFLGITTSPEDTDLKKRKYIDEMAKEALPNYPGL